MSASITNLRTVRKAKRRADQDKQAAENRARFGQSKGQKSAHAATERSATRRLDGHKRDG